MHFHADYLCLVRLVLRLCCQDRYVYVCTDTKSVSWVMLGKQDWFSSMLLLHVEFLFNAGAVVVGLLDLSCTLPVCAGCTV